MKIRKTRIKKTTKANGAVYFTAEYKWGFWWYQFDDSMGPCRVARSSYCGWLERHYKLVGKFEFNQQEARHIIDNYIRQVQYLTACAIENKLVKIEYEDYP